MSEDILKRWHDTPATPARHIRTLLDGVPIARDTLRLDAGLNYAISDGASFDLVYSGEIASGVSDHGLTATLTARY